MSDYLDNNPGAGPLAPGSAYDAEKNIRALVEDMKLAGVTIERAEANDGGGRFGYILRLGHRTCEVDIPGIELNRVRWMSQEQDIWTFPRLWVGGGSWVWKYAISCAKDLLTQEEEENA